MTYLTSFVAEIIIKVRRIVPKTRCERSDYANKYIIWDIKIPAQGGRFF